jgi:hypothetical protein
MASKSRVDRIYWWDFQQIPCASGGDWDSSLVDWNGLPRPAFYALTNVAFSTSWSASVSRDCGGPGRGNCTPVVASGATGLCCALCSNETQAYYAAEEPGMTCVQAATLFCAFNNRGTYVSSNPSGSCPLAE